MLLALWAGTVVLGSTQWRTGMSEGIVLPAEPLFTYPVTMVDEWLDLPLNNPQQTTFVRTLFTLAAIDYYPLPNGAKLEIALCGNVVSDNTTPWEPSSLTIDQLFRDTITDAEFIQTTRTDLERTIGPDWDSPGPQNIAWRVSMPASVTGTYRAIHGNIWPGSIGDLYSLQSQTPSDVPLLYPRSALHYRNGLVRLRLGSIARGGTAHHITVGLWPAIATFAQPVVLCGAIYLALPPIWRHRRRRKRQKRNECVDCGYPLMPAP